MIVEAWMAIDQATLDTLWAQAKSENPPPELKLLTNGVRGFWNDITPDEVVNVIGTEQEINDFIVLLGADFKSLDAWVQGQGVDYITEAGEFTTDPDRVLSFMPDIPVGDPPVFIPPTFDNPNWAHVFLGQPPDLKIFAGSFTIDFTQEFL